MFALLFILQLLLSAALSESNVDTPIGTLTLHGRQKHGDSAYISASFRSQQGDGIAIFSTPRSLSVSTLDGENLVRFSKLGQPAAQFFFGEGDEDKVVFQLLQDGYVEKNKRIYHIPAVAEGETLAHPDSAVKASIDALAAHPTIRLLEPAARAMGEDLGILGRDEPAAMSFYTTAMVLTQTYSSKLRATVSETANPSDRYLYPSRPGQVFEQGKFPNCDMKTCPPCQEDQCYGLCGRQCNCWSFVCGDCCYHLGCKDHDVCCDKGYTTFACFFPIGLKCDAPYKC